MKFLVDECLSPAFASALTRSGHDGVHLRDLGLQRSADAEVLEVARDQGRVLVSADTDFGTLLAGSAADSPSVIIFRRSTGRQPNEQAALLVANLPLIVEALDQGSVVVLEESRVRVRRLPITD